MKRIIPMAIVGLLLAATAFAQRKPETNPIKKDNPVFPDTTPTQSQTLPTQTHRKDTSHHPWVTEPEKKPNQQKWTDTTSPQQMDTTRNQKQYQKMDTTHPEKRDTTSKPWVTEPEKKNKKLHRRNKNYPEKTDTSMQHWRNQPANPNHMDQRRKRNTPPLQHRNNPPMTDTTSGKL